MNDVNYVEHCIMSPLKWLINEREFLKAERNVEIIIEIIIDWSYYFKL